MVPLTIERVTPASRHDFSAIVEEANEWQKARGSEGWNEPFDDLWLLPRIGRGELYLARLRQEPVAAFRLLFEDRIFWGDRDEGDSIYLHTFAVRRSHAGQGIGPAVIEAVARSGRERGLATLRLDCFLANAGLIAFYERNGLRTVGTMVVRGRAMNLMERRIGDDPGLGP